MTNPAESADTLSSITRARAELITKGHPCGRCGEYTYKKVLVKPASESQRQELGVVWHAVRICGVCEAHEELGIDDDGDVVYAG